MAASGWLTSKLFLLVERPPRLSGDVCADTLLAAETETPVPALTLTGTGGENCPPICWRSTWQICRHQITKKNLLNTMLVVKCSWLVRSDNGKCFGKEEANFFEIRIFKVMTQLEAFDTALRNLFCP